MDQRSSHFGQTLALLLMLVLCAGVQEVVPRLAAAPVADGAAAAVLIPPADYSLRTSPADAVSQREPQTRTAKLLRWLNLDTSRQYSVNMVARIGVLSSTGLLALWFVIGGVPRRRYEMPLAQLATNWQRPKVFETTRLRHRYSDDFASAFSSPATAEHFIAVQDAVIENTPAAVAAPPHPSTHVDSHVPPQPAIAKLPAHHYLLQPDFWHHDGEVHVPDLDAAVAAYSENDEILLAEVHEYGRKLLAGADALESSTPAVELESPVLAASEVPLTTELSPVVAAPDEGDILGIGEITAIAAKPGESISGDLLQLDNTDEVHAEPASAKTDTSAQTIPDSAVQLSPAVTPALPLLDQRIIVIGDSDAVLEVEKRILISAEARVITFRRWNEALRFAEVRDFDLLLINGMTEDGWTATKLYDWLAENRPGWEKRAAFALSAPDPTSDDFAARTGAWCIVHAFGPKELVGFLQAVLAPPEDSIGNPASIQ